MSSSAEQKPGNKRKMPQGKQPELWLTTPQGEQGELSLTTPQGEQSKLPRTALPLPRWEQQSEPDAFDSFELLCLAPILACALGIPLIYFLFGAWMDVYTVGLALALEMGIIVSLYQMLAVRWA